MKKNKKIWIGLGIILLVIAAVIVGIILFKKTGKQYKKTIFIGDSVKVTTKDNHIYISYKDDKAKKQDVKIYYDNKVIDGYIKTGEQGSSFYENNIQAYNSDDEYLYFDSDLIAYTLDMNVDIIATFEDSTDDINEITNYLNGSNIDISSSKVDYFMVSSFDVDKDNDYECIFSFGLIKDDEYISFVVMKKNDNFYLIDSIESTYEEDDSSSIGFVSIMDINDDGNYEYIISETAGEYAPSYYTMYNFDGSEFIKLNLIEVE